MVRIACLSALCYPSCVSFTPVHLLKSHESTLLNGFRQSLMRTITNQMTHPIKSLQQPSQIQHHNVPHIAMSRRIPVLEKRRMVGIAFALVFGGVRRPNLTKNIEKSSNPLTLRTPSSCSRPMIIFFADFL